MTRTHRGFLNLWPWATLCALLLASAQLSLAAAESEDGFRMKFVVEHAHGDLLAKGRYLRAIALLDNSHDADTFSARTNLCVARAMSGQLWQAQYPCHRAIELAEAQLRDAPPGSQHRAYAALGDAYNNRGVLNVLLGKKDDAQKDLVAAVSLPVMCHCAAGNLARLRGALEETVAAR